MVKILQGTIFDGNKYTEQILNTIEIPFTYALDVYPTTPTGMSNVLSQKNLYLVNSFTEIQLF